MKQDEQALPLGLGIRMLLEDVSYSNPLPDWFSPEEIDYEAREKSLTQRVTRYHKGEAPLAVLPVPLPARWGSEMRTWVVPAVNDQMILQSCVSSLSTAVAQQFDPTHVFSCEPSDKDDSLTLMKNQIGAWIEFQDETIKRLQHNRYILQFDIQKASVSIDRAKFFEFVIELKPGGQEAELIRLLLTAWSGNEPGVPLVNDSLFFLISAYLNCVDRVVERYSDNFIRYMDDYRVFGGSPTQLEKYFEKIGKDLAELGFRLNPRKVKLGNKEDYLEAISKPTFESSEATESPEEDSESSYVTEVDPSIGSQLEPPQVVKLVTRTLERPDTYLNEGIGRYLLGSLRRYRLNVAMYRREKETQKAPGSLLHSLLLKDRNVLPLTGSRLKQYSTDPRQWWRIVWLIYLVEQTSVTTDLRKQLSMIEKNLSMPVVAKLWARRCLQGRAGEPKRLREELHDCSYEEAGRRCYGESLCQGEGF